MWVSKEVWQDHCKRLNDLERWKTQHEVDVMDGRNFTVYSMTESEMIYHNSGHSYESYKSQRIAVKDVVNRILAHLGLQLEYVGGKPAAVEVQKVKKAA